MTEPLLWFFKVASLWLLLCLAGGGLSALAYPAFARLLQPCAPATRAACRWMFGLAVPLAAAFIVFVLMHPALAGLLVPEHCHEGVCGAHAPVYSASPLSFLIVAACSLMLLGLLAVSAVGLRLAGRRFLALSTLARVQPHTHYSIVDTAALLAWCGGTVRPKVLVSRGLIEHLSGPQFEAVLAHERAHVERRDNLKALLLHLATVAWPSPARKAIRASLSQDAEQACDLLAARNVGSPRQVAAALMALAHAGASTADGIGFASEDVRPRLEALCQTQYAHPGRVWLALVAQWLLLVVLLTGLSHWLVELVTTLGR